MPYAIPEGVASKWWTAVDVENASAAGIWDTAWAILRYLETSPQAKDTVEGIAQWWLWPELTEPLLREAKQAMALLVSGGLILDT